MLTAIEIFYTIYNQFMNTVFNRLIIDYWDNANITIGWVFISIIIMSILIRNVLAVPHKGQTITREYPYSSARYEKKWH